MTGRRPSFATGLATGLATVPALALLAACTATPQPSERPEPAPEPRVALGFTQLIPREGTRDALLRITNTGGSDLVVESVALDWPGYAGGEPSPADPTIPPGRTLDVRLRLPDPTCEEPTAAPVGVVATSAGTVRAELEASGETYLRRLWRTQCDTALVAGTVRLGFSRAWRVVGTGTGARALGDLVLERRGGTAPVAVTDVDGSVLHDLRLPGATSLPAGDDVVRLPLEILPGNRCDEHARGQATAPFDFLVRLRIGDLAPVAQPLVVPLAATLAATDALDAACAAR